MGARDNKSVAEIDERCLPRVGRRRVKARQVATGGSIDTAAHHPDRRAARAVRKGVPTARRLANVDSQAVTSHREMGIESIKGVLGRESREL